MTIKETINAHSLKIKRTPIEQAELDIAYEFLQRKYSYDTDIRKLLIKYGKIENVPAL